MISLQNYSSYLKCLLFFSQMIIWCVINNILEDQNTYLIETWCTRPSKKRIGYLDSASKLVPFFSYYVNHTIFEHDLLCILKESIIQDKSFQQLFLQSINLCLANICQSFRGLEVSIYFSYFQEHIWIIRIIYTYKW